MTARLMQVIETEVCRGKGTEESPLRTVTQFWSTDGRLLAESDPTPDGEPTEHENEQLARAVRALSAGGYTYVPGAQEWRPPVNKAAFTLRRLLDVIDTWRAPTNPATELLAPLFEIANEAKRALP